MASENLTRKSTKLPEENHENSNVHPTNRVHPKVTTKKTFFDIHRIRRSSINVGISEPDGSIHPKIEWSAGSTDVGSGFQSQTDGGRTILDPMVPILLPNEPLNSSNTKRPSPPVPNPWGTIDVEPTKPEEIMHLINPSQVVEKAETLRDTLATKSRKSIVDKFLKSAAKIASVKRLEPQTFRKGKLPEENVQMTNPEEEFQFLNENYVREGILPKNFQSDFPTRVSEQEKKVKIQKEAEKPGTINMPLPARRSCEPQDVKDLRRLRDSDPQPGPSRDMTLRRETSTSQTVDEFFPTSNLFVLDNENDLQTKNTRTDSAKELNETKKNGDRFKIENPFSDFSLQTLSRKKIVFKPNAMETKTIPRYPDPSQPGTSKDVSSVEALRPKVSHHETIENLKSETRESSFSEFQESRKRKTSFLDKAVAIVSSKTLSSTMRQQRMNFENVSRSSNEVDQLDSTWTLGPLIRRILGPNFVRSCAPSKFLEVDEGINEFDHFSKALQSNAVVIIVGKTFDHVSILTDNSLGFYLINYLENSFPVIIFNAMETLRICGRNIGTDYLQSMGSAELSRVGESLTTPQDQRKYSFLLSNPITDLTRQGNLVEKISRYLVHVIFSEGSSDDHHSFAYLNPMSTLKSAVADINGVEKSNFWESYFQSFDDRSLLIERENTLFVDFFAKFLNFHQPYRAR